MDELLYEMYKEVEFDQNVLKMFAELILRDEVMRKVFNFIVKSRNNPDGVVLNDITSNVKVRRKKQKANSKQFRFVIDNIDRRQADKAVDILCYMTLCYSTYDTRFNSKRIKLTERGVNLAKIMVYMNQNKED